MCANVCFICTPWNWPHLRLKSQLCIQHKLQKPKKITFVWLPRKQHVCIWFLYSWRHMLNDKWRQVYQLLQFSAFIFTITRSHCVISRPSAQSDSATFFGGGVLEKGYSGYSRDACTDFDAQYVKRRGSAQGSAFWGLRNQNLRFQLSFSPQNPPFWAPFRRDWIFSPENSFNIGRLESTTTTTV